MHKGQTKGGENNLSYNRWLLSSTMQNLVVLKKVRAESESVTMDKRRTQEDGSMAKFEK
jgi:hypothetical protein